MRLINHDPGDAYTPPWFSAQRTQLVVDAHPTILAALARSSADYPIDPPSIRPNVKWFRVLLNRVPTGTTSSRPAYNPDKCHQVLTAEIPSYASLPITQEPSWVRKPDTYNHCALSCLATSHLVFFSIPT